MSDVRQLLEAASFAARAHRGQTRKDGETPYASHPFRVCLIVRDVFGFDDRRMLVAALLHDTVEDTTTDFDDLAGEFGEEIAAWVVALSKDKRLPDQEREAAYVQGLLAAPWQVQVVKLGDVFDNLSDAPKLPPEKRGQAVRRAEGYVNALKQSQSAELRRPLQLVEELLQKTRQG